MSSPQPLDEQPTAVIAAGPLSHRRVAVLPLVITGAVLTATIAVGAVIAAQAGAAGPAPVQAAVPVSSVPPAEPAPVAEPEPEPAAEPEQLPAAAPNQCLDHRGDAIVDLESVTLQPGRRGTVLAVFELAGALPAGEAALSLLAEGDRGYVFRAEFDDGRVERYRVAEEGRQGDSRLNREGVRLDGSRVVLELPTKHVDRLGGSWSWSAFTSVEGMLDDSCGETLTPYREP